MGIILTWGDLTAFWFLKRDLGSVQIFNEDFVEETLFLEDSLMDGSYNVFIGSKDLKEGESCFFIPDQR